MVAPQRLRRIGGEKGARAGPSDDHRLLWVYHARGLPVQVIAETVEWRRICDPDGQMSWVHKRTTDGRRTLMPLGKLPLPLRAKPRGDAAVSAYLAPRAVADLDKCQKDWCRVRIGQADGWAPAAAFWGLAETPQCPRLGPSSDPNSGPNPGPRPALAPGSR
jgi:SH3-like domain-containing protein